MKKPLALLATGIIVATTLSACDDTEGTDVAADEIVESAAATPDPDTEEAGENDVADAPDAPDFVPIDLPVASTSLVGNYGPEGVSLICVGDYAFLYTWRTSLYAGGAGTTRFEEQDELCVDIHDDRE